MKLVLIRHGEIEYNKNKIFAGTIDCKLLPEAIEEAKKIKFTEKFDKFICSPLERAKQTLFAIFLKIKKEEVIIDKRIIEVNLGDWQGKSKKEVDQEKRELYKKGEYNPPNAETREQVDKRVCEFVEEMFENNNLNNNICVVCHNGVM